MAPSQPQNQTAQQAAFGECLRTIDLGRTFRSVDRIALPARRFVLRNPSQIKKQVVTAATTDTPAIRLAYYERGQDEALLRACLAELSGAISGRASVLLLGRYGLAQFPKSMRR